MIDPMEKKKPQPKAAEPVPSKVPLTHVDFAFTRENYRLMLIGLALMVLGFILMIGGGSKDPNIFNPDIFSFRGSPLHLFLSLQDTWLRSLRS